MIFANHSFKTKFYALIALFILLFCTAYKRSFSTFFSIWREHTTLSARSEEINTKIDGFRSLVQELDRLDTVIGNGAGSPEKVQQEIIGFVTQRNSVTISNLQPIHQKENGRYRINTYQIDLSGTINDLVKLAYDFEKIFPHAKLVSLKFYSVKKPNVGDIPHLKIILQNYESI